MTKELEALKRTRGLICAKGTIEEINKNTEDYKIIEQALKDLEWLISKVDVDFLNRLSDPEDKLRFLRIAGYNISYEGGLNNYE